MKICFYNHYGVGDLFESREFVRDWMRLAGVTTARYAHRKLPGFFDDLPGIKSVDVPPEMDMRASVTRTKTPDGEDELWVNTWIGRGGDYVVWPGVGCTVEGLYRMHNDLLRAAAAMGVPFRGARNGATGAVALPRTIAEYIPTIDYTRVALGNLHTWIDAHRGERLVLVCNGNTGSGQAVNFDMFEMVNISPRLPNVTYLLTHHPPDLADWEDDIVFTDKLTQRDRREVGAYGPCDFNAISYLSRFCDIVVGRCSGAQMGTQVLENWMDSTKTQVCFTHHRNGACFVLNPEALGLKMRVVHSAVATPAEAAQVLEQVLQR